MQLNAKHDSTKTDWNFMETDMNRCFQDAQCPKALSALSRSLATQRSLEFWLMTLASSHLTAAKVGIVAWPLGFGTYTPKNITSTSQAFFLFLNRLVSFLITSCNRGCYVPTYPLRHVLGQVNNILRPWSSCSCIFAWNHANLSFGQFLPFAPTPRLCIRISFPLAAIGLAVFGIFTLA